MPLFQALISKVLRRHQRLADGKKALHLPSLFAFSQFTLFLHFIFGEEKPNTKGSLNCNCDTELVINLAIKFNENQSAINSDEEVREQMSSLYWESYIFNGLRDDGVR